MRQRWWVAIVAVLGIGLAILLFPRPDTGGEISPAQPGAPVEAGAVEPGEAGGVTAVAPGAKRAKSNDRGRKRPVPKPPSVLEERRSRTEVIYASKLVTPFSAIRYTLMKMKDDPAAQSLAEDMGVVLNGDIREMRVNPDGITWDDLQVKTDQVMEKVAGSPFATDPTVAKGLERYKEFVTEYHTTKASGGADNPDNEPVATPGGAAGGDPPKEME